jgi:NADH:ubiquinone oxidoreductase subunit 3 (subunit A)
MPLIFVVFPVAIGLFFSWIVRVQRLQVVLAQKQLVPVVNSV